jgi:hypothetical protein
LNPPLSDFGDKQQAKSVPPEPDGFMTHINTAFMEQIFAISKRKWETHIHHTRQADDFGRRLGVAKGETLGHPVRLRNYPALLKLVSSDNA